MGLFLTVVIPAFAWGSNPPRTAIGLGLTVGLVSAVVVAITAYGERDG